MVRRDTGDGDLLILEIADGENAVGIGLRDACTRGVARQRVGVACP